MSNSKEDFFVQATLTPEQARVVVNALDVFMRLHIGQFNIIREQFFGRDMDVETVEKLLFEARRHIFPELNGGPGHSHGISGCPSESGKIAYDVLQVIRRAESYGRHPEGGITVNFDDPLFVSKSEPKPSAKILNVLDRLADI